MMWQGILLPNGICFSLCGPFSGSTNDKAMLNRTQVVAWMDQNLPPTCAILADQGYSLSHRVIVPFEIGANATQAEKVSPPASSLATLTAQTLTHVVLRISTRSYPPCASQWSGCLGPAGTASSLLARLSSSRTACASRTAWCPRWCGSACS